MKPFFILSIFNQLQPMTEVAILAGDGDYSLKILNKSPFRIFAPTKQKCQCPQTLMKFKVLPSYLNRISFYTKGSLQLPLNEERK